MLIVTGLTNKRKVKFILGHFISFADRKATYQLERIRFNTINCERPTSLGNYFDQFVQGQVLEGRYKNVSEVIRAGLRLLENEENKAAVLKNAIQEGIDSGLANDFEPGKNLKELKPKRKTNG